MTQKVQNRGRMNTHAPLPWNNIIEDREKSTFSVVADDGTVVVAGLSADNAELIVGSVNVCRTLQQHLPRLDSSFIAAAKTLLPQPQDAGKCLELLRDVI